MPKTDSNFSAIDSIHPVSKKLIEWYAQRKRSLPWRDEPIPYAVWVAEIMAQQTRLDTMLPYLERWMKKYPDVGDLAAGKLQDVLNLWEGLGYYQRARNLHKAAGIIMNAFEGKIPDQVDQLKKLPGIGPYTAGAIVSIAFAKDEAAVDGNAARVLARVFNIGVPINESKGMKQAWALAQDILPQGKASDFNQSLMDLGAFVCLPRKPRCEECPLIKDCEAKQVGIENEIPVRAASNKIPTRIYVSGIIKKRGRILLRQRPQEGLLGGLWEFPNVEIDKQKNSRSALRNLMGGLAMKGKVGDQVSEIQHRYSHFQAEVLAYEIKIDSGEPSPKFAKNYRWFLRKELSAYPMGKIDRQIANQILSDVG